jgi:hypothetical protein
MKNMNSLSKDADLHISDLRFAAVLVFAILNLAVFLITMVSVWHYGDLFFSAGGNGPVIYPIWKAIHHLPVYEWPCVFPFSVSLFNYLFYFTYASLFKLFGVSDAGIMTWGSLCTPAFAMIGAIAQWKLVQSYLNLSGARSFLSLFFAMGLWICTSMVRGWAFTIRPDMPAIALVMIALWIVVRQPRFGFAYAGLFFYLAWSFKQSAVLALVGVCLFLVSHKRWRELSMMIVVFAALTAATLLLGTPEYRYDTLVAPRLVTDFSVLHAVPIASKFLMGNAYWVLAPIALIVAGGTRQVNNVVRVLIIVFTVALVGGLVGLTKAGAYSEYLFEAFVAGSTLLQIAVFMAPGRLVNALILFGSIQPAIQLAIVPSGAGVSHTFGTVGIATAEQYAEAVALRELLASMKKPIFTTDGVFSLPWFSTEDHTPALVIEQFFHDGTRAMCQNGCVEGMLERGEIPTVMLGKSDVFDLKSLSPSYVKIADASHLGQQWSIYVLRPLPTSPNLPTRP